SYMMIDGHLRAETTPDQEVAVLVLDVTEGEADKLLATLDPLSAMATADSEKLGAIIASVDFENDALKRLIQELGAKEGIMPELDNIAEDEPLAPDEPT